MLHLYSDNRLSTQSEAYVMVGIQVLAALIDHGYIFKLRLLGTNRTQPRIEWNDGELCNSEVWNLFK